MGAGRAIADETTVGPATKQAVRAVNSREGEGWPAGSTGGTLPNGMGRDVGVQGLLGLGV